MNSPDNGSHQNHDQASGRQIVHEVNGDTVKDRAERKGRGRRPPAMPLRKREGGRLQNGIFLIGSKGASVISSDEYPLQGVDIRYAVQSGPLLLRQGRIHPSFNASSLSRLHRNGVGVAKDGTVVFAMTDFNSPKFPNLHEFARLFVSLGCDNALFLDGDLSQMRAGVDLTKPSNNFSSIIAVIKTGNDKLGGADQPAIGSESRPDGKTKSENEERQNH